MKIKNQPQITLLTFLFIGIASVLSSCSKDNSTPVSGNSYITVVNAVEGSSAQDLYLDNAKVTASPVVYGSASGTFSTTSGNHAAEFKDDGGTTVNASFSTNFEVDDSYSIYYTGNNTTNSGMVVQNDVSSPPTGFVKVRFIQLSPAIPTLSDVTNNATSDKLATKIAYKTVTPYYIVDPSSTFSLYASATTNLVINIPVQLFAGKTYTVLLSGATTATISYHLITESE